MPLIRSRQPIPRSRARTFRSAVALAAGVIPALSGSVLLAQSPSEGHGPLSVRSRQLEFHYRLSGAGPSATIELWSTRDRGATWQRVASRNDLTGPLEYTAPSEGLYGFILLVRDGERASREDPRPRETPQRWVFVDGTPPLAQWDRVEPGEDFALRRTLRLAWTAYDDNLPGRPVSLAFRTPADSSWRIIDPAALNSGRYDWTVPDEVHGQLTLLLSVRDLGGHVVERTFGPVTVPIALRPADGGGRTEASVEPPVVPPARQTASTRPAEASISPLPAERRRAAEELARQAAWHMERGQHAVAAERLHEALEIDPEMPEAVSRLAWIYADQREYERALELYNRILTRRSDDPEALRGAALAHLAQRRYAQAREVLHKRLAADERNAEAWFDLGDVLFLMGQTSEARAHWRRAMSVDASARAIIEKARSRLETYAEPGTVGTAGAATDR